ncbi:sulfite exporter TauE/SafE family protein [Thioalkalivibrio sulfidiphilus]|uniref:sulfite exporter TauE/SafE family protein n=1 Tax=Thioalkalivibrio sulfidiphilus TaxID=1033854 RepID=UPI0003717693|nr:sulfite exporter TauE/SafE family protein [Thioalkalivibrio sulfidiphilus]
MDFLHYEFARSGVETSLWLPPLVAFLISLVTSMVGVCGAFLLLPFQISVLNYTAPSVSATNLVFNLIAIPSGVYRFIREGRMLWPLNWVIVAGTLPGVGVGYYVRVYHLQDPGLFKVFVGMVLLYLSLRLLAELAPWRRRGRKSAPGMKPGSVARNATIAPSRITFTFGSDTYSFSLPAMALLAFSVGIIGGIYGIGGGAIIAPFCVAIFGLPVYTVAGAALAATFITSIAGVLLYSLLPAPPGVATQPDWLLGGLFGIGGALGMYVGARLQRHVPHGALKLLLGAVILLLAMYYLTELLTLM